MKIKQLLSLTLCLGMMGSVSLPIASAAEENPQYEKEHIALSEVVIRDGGTTELPASAVPYMSVTAIYTMTIRNLVLGEMVTSKGKKTFSASDFPYKVAQINTNFTSDSTSGKVRVGLCYYDKDGVYRADVVTYFKPNERDSHYVDTSAMDPDRTYYGFVNNTQVLSAITGTAQICRMD